MTRRVLAFALVSALAASSCGDADPTTPTTPTEPKTRSLASRLPKGGAVSKTFVTQQAGVITVTFAGTTPPGTVVGVGVGVPLVGIADCGITQAVTTAGSGSPVIAISAIAGTYCVVVYDIGNLTAATDFDGSVTHP